MDQIIDVKFIELAMSAVSILGAWGLFELARYIRSRTGNERLAQAVSDMGMAAIKAVRLTEKRWRPLYSDGKLPSNEQRQMATLARKTFNKVVNPAALKVLERNVNDLDVYVDSVIESAHSDEQIFVPPRPKPSPKKKKAKPKAQPKKKEE